MDEQFKSLNDKLENVAARLDKTPSIEDLQKSIAESQKATAEAVEVKEKLGIVHNDLDGMRKLLEHNLGKSGAEDFEKVMSDFVKAVYHIKNKLAVPAWLQKAVADYVTDVDAVGGFLAPRGVSAEVIKLSLIAGDIWPKLGKATVNPGMSLRVPWESTLASVQWNLAQGTASREIDPHIIWGADTVFPQWIAGNAMVDNTAMTAPGISIPFNITAQLIAKLIDKIEFGVINGLEATSSPSDGIILETNINEQTAMATVTVALLNTFLGECLADHPASYKRKENYLVTTPAVHHTLKGVMTQTGSGWGDPARTPEDYFSGYQVLVSEFATCVHPTTSVRNAMILAPLGKILVCWNGQFSVDFDTSIGFKSNETCLRVGTHADFALGNPDMYHFAPYTALA